MKLPGVLCILFFALVSCHNNPRENDTSISTDQKTNSSDSLLIPVDTGVVAKYHLYINKLPFPYKILDRTASSGLPFENANMNPVNNASKYNEAKYKALNLGVYGTDISFCVAYGQYQEISSYVKVAKKMADELNIPSAFSENGIAKYELYRDNRDSLVLLIFRSYHEIDTVLKTNESVALAGLVVTGCWLEGLYLSTKSLAGQLKSNQNKVLYKTIWEQKYYLNNILMLLNEFKRDDFFRQVITGLEGIRSCYSSLDNYGELSEADVRNISQKVDALRDRITDASL